MHSALIQTGHSLSDTAFFREEEIGVKHFSSEEIKPSLPLTNTARKFTPVGFSYSVELPVRYSESGIIAFEKDLADVPDADEFISVVGLIIASHHADLLSGRSGGSSSTHDGAPGAPGAPGIAGPKGETGSVGGKGETGNVGGKGETGNVGGKGETGSAGSKGKTGSAGSTGKTGSAGKKGKPRPSGSVEDLTSRQSVILSEMRRGKTNAAIALDLDYSESLIRQETIEIYRILGITGRDTLTREEII